MAKVYIINNAGYDYSKAKEYGELCSVTHGRVPIFKTSSVGKALQDRLKDFTEEDYVLLSGPTILNVMASVELFSRFDTLKFLIFDAKQQDYVVRHLNK